MRKRHLPLSLLTYKIMKIISFITSIGTYIIQKYRKLKGEKNSVTVIGKTDEIFNLNYNSRFSRKLQCFHFIMAQYLHNFFSNL